MAITKEVIQDKIEIVTEWKHLQIRERTTVKEDGVVISSSYTNRYVLMPGRVDDSDNFIDTDLSSESDEVKGLANLLWTDDIKESWKQHLIDTRPG